MHHPIITKVAHVKYLLLTLPIGFWHLNLAVRAHLDVLWPQPSLLWRLRHLLLHESLQPVDVCVLQSLLLLKRRALALFNHLDIATACCHRTTLLYSANDSCLFESALNEPYACLLEEDVLHLEPEIGRIGPYQYRVEPPNLKLADLCHREDIKELELLACAHDDVPCAHLF